MALFPNTVTLAYNELSFNELGYNELGYNKHLVITNRFLSKFGPNNTQINPVITNPGYNEQKCPVPSCSF
jgi:hypothetical protein